MFVSARVRGIAAALGVIARSEGWQRVMGANRPGLIAVIKFDESLWIIEPRERGFIIASPRFGGSFRPPLFGGASFSTLKGRKRRLDFLPPKLNPHGPVVVRGWIVRKGAELIYYDAKIFVAIGKPDRQEFPG